MNNIQQGMQTDATCNIQQFCVRLIASEKLMIVYLPQRIQ